MNLNKKRKGIILAGGTGSRLFPVTIGISKQLVPVYDKPMIYYPLTTLMRAGITEILIITNSEYLSSFKRLLEDGSQFGISIQYAIQNSPNGIAEAFLIGESFIGDNNVALVLGDNLFYGYQLDTILKQSCLDSIGSTIFAYSVNNPKDYGVIEFDDNLRVTKITEKPKEPKSNWAITGLYLYDNSVIEKTKSIKPSKRGELEITDVNMLYLEEGMLNVELMKPGNAWLDTGNPDSLHEASSYIRTLEKRQGLKVGCPEELAWRLKLINDKQLGTLSEKFKKTTYGEYLMNLIGKGSKNVY